MLVQILFGGCNPKLNTSSSDLESKPRKREDEEANMELEVHVCNQQSWHNVRFCEYIHEEGGLITMSIPSTLCTYTGKPPFVT
jgi:hypothetical protein